MTQSGQNRIDSLAPYICPLYVTMSIDQHCVSFFFNLVLRIYQLKEKKGRDLIFDMHV